MAYSIYLWKMSVFGRIRLKNRSEIVRKQGYRLQTYKWLFSEGKREFRQYSEGDGHVSALLIFDSLGGKF